ncbi:putative FMN-binding regulatory protein PaiB [Marmoricola bigeumensis]|uniref:FMN-binding regulatory protein PaiB n=1 Tax=Nocardioides marmoribigeumensis TaxID=433649 RepID=A0ABU2BV53_9ACTN|nr:putative FMN-binding regulatory protein PaiB [Nocardioides marmoribigeumensis]
MYVPPFNAMDEEDRMRAFVAQSGAAQLVTVGADGYPVATLLPIIWSGTRRPHLELLSRRAQGTVEVFHDVHRLREAVTRLTAKLSQNRSSADQDGVVAGLLAEPDAASHAVAEEMRAGPPGFTPTSRGRCWHHTPRARPSRPRPGRSRRR